MSFSRMYSAIAVLLLVVITGCRHQVPETTFSSAGACSKVSHYNIPAQRFDENAQQLVHATGCSIQTDLSVTGATRARPVQGEMSIREAVQTAVSHTGLAITHGQPDRLIVE